MLASSEGCYGVVELLLDRGAQVEVECARGGSAIHTGSAQKREIASHVPQVNTALATAAGRGHAEVAKLLLSRGAAVNNPKLNASSALFAAASSGQVDAGGILVDAGADVNQSGNCGVTPLVLAAQEGHVAFVKFLLERGASVDKPIQKGWTALFSAADQGHVEVGRRLIHAGANVNAALDDDSTPLMLASQHAFVKLLHENGANSSTKRVNGNTALWEAVAKGNEQVARALLEKDVDIDHVPQNGFSPLMVAADVGRSRLVKILLEHGADVNLQRPDGWTALHFAAFKGHLESCRTLLEHGATGSQVDAIGPLPMVLASQEGHEEIVTLLLDCGVAVDGCRSNRWRALHSAAQCGYEELARLLLQCNADVNGKLLDGRSPLHLAVEGGHVDLSRLLLDKGAAVDCADVDKRTPLMIAAYSGNTESFRLLLERSADVSPVDLQGRRADEIARESNYYDIASMIAAQMPGQMTQVSFDRGATLNADLLIDVREICRVSWHFARGSYGKVYKGKWLDADVVIKRVQALSEADKGAFWREAHIWKTAKHPHIVPLFGAYVRGSGHFLVCKEATNGKLKDYLERELKQGDRPTVWQKLYEAAAGLRFLHERNIVHCDLKCNQILVGRDGEAMLTDFGMSFVMGESGGSSGVKGAIRWKAPECIRRENPSRPTKEADVYSFGMCVVEAVTGTIPWPNMPAERVHEFKSKPEAFTDAQWVFVESLLTSDPSSRLSMAAAMEELNHFAQEESGTRPPIFEPQPEPELGDSRSSSSYL
jgi:ankyrin repeat protein/tRNA A-37 threonylcarbamoyl transferase component Bud32